MHVRYKKNIRFFSRGYLLLDDVSEYSAGKYVTALYRDNVSYIDVLKEYNVLYEQDNMMERWIQFMDRHPIVY